MKQLGVEPVFAGTGHGAKQRLGLRLAVFPNRLEIVRRIELPQQRGVQLLAADPQIRGAIDAIADRRVDRGGDRRRKPLRRAPGRPEQAAQTGSPGVDAMAAVASTPATAAAPSATAAADACRSVATAGEPASVKQGRLAWRMIAGHDMIAPAGEHHYQFVGSRMRKRSFIAE